MRGGRTLVPGAIDSLRFKGGYRFQGFQGVPTDELVVLAPGPHASIPLESMGSAIVKRGDQIAVGQVVGETDLKFHRTTISPVSGTVASISDRLVQVDCGGDQAWSPVAGASAEWENLSTDVIEDLLFATGSCSVAAVGIPTRHGTSNLAPGEVRRVVVHDSGSELYRASTAVLMMERDTTHLLQGLQILQKIFPNAECHVVMSAAWKSVLQSLGAPEGRNAAGAPIVHVGSPKYPQHQDAVLLGSLFADDAPPNPSASDSGALVLNIQALLQIRDAVVLGKPNIDRIVALSGPGFTSNLHVCVRVGTPVKQVIEGRINQALSPRVVFNSAMTGEQMVDSATPIGFDCSVLIAIPETGPELLPFARPGWRSDSFSFTFLSSLVKLPKTLDDNIHGEERACIACGYCEQVCPVGILPYHLHRYVEREIIDEKLLRYGAFRCIDCNLCTYVCPSKIPLARLIADGKQALLDEGFDTAPTDDSKEGAL